MTQRGAEGKTGILTSYIEPDEPIIPVGGPVIPDPVDPDPVDPVIPDLLFPDRWTLIL